MIELHRSEHEFAVRGQATLLFNYSYRDDRNMHDTDRQRLRETLVRAGNTGLTRAQLQAILGLTPAAVMRYLPPNDGSTGYLRCRENVTDASITATCVCSRLKVSRKSVAASERFEAAIFLP